MPFPHKNKNPAARITSKRQDFLTKKGISTANPSYVPRKLFFLISCIILYQIFRYTQIFVGFFSAKQKPRISSGQNAFFKPNLSVFHQLLLSHIHHLLLLHQDIQLLRIQKSSRLPRLLRYHLLFSRHLFFLIKEIAPDFSPLALPSGSLVQEFSDFFNYPMNFSSLSFLIFFVFFFALLVHVRKVQPADSVSI